MKLNNEFTRCGNCNKINEDTIAGITATNYSYQFILLKKQKQYNNVRSFRYKLIYLKKSTSLQKQ